MRVVLAGVTLIELVIYVALIGLLGNLVFNWVLQIHHLESATLATHTALAQGQTALELLTADLRQAQACELLPATDKFKQILAIEYKNTPKILWKTNNKAELFRIEEVPGSLRRHQAKIADRVKQIEINPIPIPSNGLIKISIKMNEPRMNFTQMIYYWMVA